MNIFYKSMKLFNKNLKRVLTLTVDNVLKIFLHKRGFFIHFYPKRAKSVSEFSTKFLDDLSYLHFL